MTRLVDMTGERYGRLVVLGRTPSDKGGARWRCACDCGEETVARGYHLRRGTIASCGCLMRESLRKSDDQITYNSAHYRVRRAKGRPSSHLCAQCEAPATVWALRREAERVHPGDDGHGNIVYYSGNPDDYFPLCGSCHWHYDRRPAGKLLRGKRGTWKLYECRLCNHVSEFRRGFYAAGGDNDIWECRNDRACNRRRSR